MKLIIDIPEHIYETVINTGTFGYYRFDTRKAIKKGTSIPDNATNGDYVKAIMKAGMIHSVLFEENAKVDDEEFVCMYYEGKIIGDFDLNWWNSPYQKGGKE